MTTSQQLSRVLRRKGWTYDAGDGRFRDSDGKAIRGYRKLLAHESKCDAPGARKSPQRR